MGSKKKIQLICQLCTKEFAKKGNLVRHQQARQCQTVFRCSFCDYSTAYKSHLTNHIRSHTKEKPYKCPKADCEFSATLSSNLKQHQRIHNKEDESLLRFRCSHCDYSTIYKGHLTLHIRCHTEEKPYKCPEPNCVYSATQKVNLKRHQLIHYKGTNLLEFKCKICAYKTWHSSHFSQHLNSHSEMKPFKCNLCSSQFKSERSLKYHVANIHATEKPLKCPQPNCKHRSALNSTLAVHMRKVHFKKKKIPSSESQCQLTADAAVERTGQLETHSEEESLKCSLCPFSCRDPAELTLHFSVHTAVIPVPVNPPVFSCQFCPFASIDETTLSQHIQVAHPTVEFPQEYYLLVIPCNYQLSQ